MKKFLLLIGIVLAAFSLSAIDFDGLTSIGLNYEYREGYHMNGMTIQNSGYFDDFPIGYFVGINADFDLKHNGNTIGLIIAPSYRYKFDNVSMTIETSLGLSTSGVFLGSDDYFSLGIGGYIGATYYIDRFAVLLGCNLGYDMLSVDLKSGDIGYTGDFYVSPAISFGICY